MCPQMQLKLKVVQALNFDIHYYLSEFREKYEKLHLLSFSFKKHWTSQDEF